MLVCMCVCISVCLCHLQIYHEAKKFGKLYNINVVCAYGGGSMYEQSKACEEGAEIIVATPVGVFYHTLALSDFSD